MYSIDVKVTANPYIHDRYAMNLNVTYVKLVLLTGDFFMESFSWVTTSTQRVLDVTTERLELQVHQHIEKKFRQLKVARSGSPAERKQETLFEYVHGNEAKRKTKIHSQNDKKSLDLQDGGCQGKTALNSFILFCGILVFLSCLRFAFLLIFSGPHGGCGSVEIIRKFNFNGEFQTIILALR